MGASTGLLPLQKIESKRVLAQGATTDAEAALFRMPYTGTLGAATFAADAAITGANTNYRSLQVINHGALGSGNTIMASIDFTNGINAIAFKELALTLSGTAANLNANAGDIISVKSVHTGTGIADPGGLVSLTLNRD